MLLCLCAAPAGAAAKPRPACLACHALHYADQGSCTGCHRGNAASARKNIAHQLLIAGRYAGFTLGNTAVVKEGERLMEQLACRRCHVSGGRGNSFAASLDALLATKPAAEVADAVKFPAQGMPDFRLDETRITPLVNAVFAGGRNAGEKRRERPLTVHFLSSPGQSRDVFSGKCGACHRALTERQGLLGGGEIGPNLSGLLTEFYPADFPGGGRWTPERLRNWIDNPRRLAAHALMQPVRLDDREFRELTSALGARQDRPRQVDFQR